LDWGLQKKGGRNTPGGNPFLRGESKGRYGLRIFIYERRNSVSKKQITTGEGKELAETKCPLDGKEGGRVISVEQKKKGRPPAPHFRRGKRVEGKR